MVKFDLFSSTYYMIKLITNETEITKFKWSCKLEWNFNSRWRI